MMTPMNAASHKCACLALQLLCILSVLQEVWSLQAFSSPPRTLEGGETVPQTRNLYAASDDFPGGAFAVDLLIRPQWDWKKKASAELVQMRQRWREMDDVTTLSCWCCSLLLVRTEQAFTYTHTPHIEQQQSQDHQEGLFCRLTAKPNTH